MHWPSYFLVASHITLLLFYIQNHRWALYPPGRVPAGVTVHVNEEDGDVNIDSPTSLQVLYFFIIIIVLLYYSCYSFNVVFS
jgi:hypothetical protein